MKTIRTCRTFHGGPISVVALSLLEQRTFPVRVSDIVAGDAHMHYEGRLSAGDIDCNWKLDLYSNGSWYAKADLHDGGVVVGDSYRVSLWFNSAVGTSFDGQINVVERRHASHESHGIDSRVRDNWLTIIKDGPSVHLDSKPDVGQLVADIGLALAAFGSAIFFSDGKEKKMRPCADGGSAVGNGVDNQPKPCIEVYEER